MRLNNQRQYRMGIEALEDKLLLAGDVTAAVVDGNLVIRGDAESNGVAITSGDMPGEYLVGGLMAGDGPTSVNGNFHRAVINGVSGNILVGLGAGDDVANFFDLRVARNVAVSTGVGNDHVNFGGPRNDAGDPNSIVRGHLAVDLGDGNDRLRLGGTDIAHGLAADAGAGDDVVGVVGSRIHGISGIRTDGGNDDVLFERSFSELARINTGRDSDRVALVNTAFARVYVDAGAGDDRVTLDGLHARAAWINGGRGDDSLNVQGENHINHLRVMNFETTSGEEDSAEANRFSAIDGLFT